jgi:hypothetical protein
MTLNGCAGSQPKPTSTNSKLTTTSPLVLPDSVVAQNKGDIEGLYNSWIKSYIDKKESVILHANRNEVNASENAIKDGFVRFCTASGGATTIINERFGDKHRCLAPNGNLIGEFTVTRYDGNKLGIVMDSQQRIERRAGQKIAYNERKSLNGPTGIVETDEGRFKFLRIGNLNERQLLEIEYDAGKTISIEKIAKIEFAKTCCKYIVTRRDGSILPESTARLVQLLTSNWTQVYGGGAFGLPIVLVDPVSGQPYTRIFSNYEGLRAIIFDPESQWSSIPTEKIQTTYAYNSVAALEKYTNKLRLEANNLFAEASKNGWLQLLPDGKLTPRLNDHLQSKLRLYSHYSSCKGDAIVGVVNLDEYFRCHVAVRELKLVVPGGYSLVTGLTPLSATIVLNKIKDDLR